jgi:integrase
MKLTAANIRTIALPAGVTERTFFDDDLAGFGLRIRSTGGRSLVVQYKIGSLHRRVVLGAVGAIEFHKAKTTAKELLAKVRLGEDPFADRMKKRQRNEQTFGALLPRYLAYQTARLRPRTMIDLRRYLEVHARPWHSLPVTSIDRAMVATMLAKLADNNHGATSNRFRSWVSGFYVWLCREGLAENNPVAFTNKAVENGSRERVLTDPELVSIWRGANSSQFGIITKLLILTGARREEIGGLRWSEVDLDKALITLPGERTKNGKVQTIPLSPQALKLLAAYPQRDRGFSGWSKGRRELDEAMEKAPVSGWTLHDFRRALSTALHDRFNITPHVIEAVLGHVGSRSGVSGVYNLASYDTQKRAALDRWGDHIEALVGGKRRTAVVKKFRRG